MSDNNEIIQVVSHEKDSEPMVCKRECAENKGVTEKLWIRVPDGKKALFKFTQFKENGTHTNAHFAEKFVSELCGLTSAKCCEIEIAEYEGRIGCLSYSFLPEKEELINKIKHQGREDLVPQIENGVNQELVDGTALIQNIAPDFDLKDAKNKTRYTLKLVEDSYKAIAPSTEVAQDSFNNFLKKFMIDCMTMHYDRNPSNLGVLITRFKDEFLMEEAPGFDNGTTLGMSLPVEVVRDILAKKDGIPEYCKGVKSKIGWEKEFVDYEYMMDSVLNNYYDNVKDFIGEIDQNITPEAIEKIFEQKHYKDMQLEYKEFSSSVITHNKERLIEKYHYHTYRKELESVIEQGELASTIENNRISVVLPEFENCLGVQQRGEYHQFTVDKYAQKCSENVSNIDELCNKNDIEPLNLSKKETRLLSWISIFHDLGKKEVQKEEKDENGNIKDTFYNHPKATLPIAQNVMQKMGFDKNTQERITKVISYHDRYQIDTKDAVKHLIYGRDNQEGLGQENLKLFIGIRLSEIEAQREDAPARNDNLKALRGLPGLAQEVINDKEYYDKEALTKTPLSGFDIIKLGIEGKEIGKVLDTVCEIQTQFPNFKKGDIVEYLKNQGYAMNGYSIDFDPRTIRDDIQKCKNNGFSFGNKETQSNVRVIALNGKNCEYIAKRILEENHNINGVWMVNAEKGLEEANILKVTDQEVISENISIPNENIEQILDSGAINGETILDKNLAQRLKKVPENQRGKVTINMLRERPNGFKSFVQNALGTDIGDRKKEQQR